MYIVIKSFSFFVFKEEDNYRSSIICTILSSSDVSTINSGIEVRKLNIFD